MLRLILDKIGLSASIALIFYVYFWGILIDNQDRILFWHWSKKGRDWSMRGLTIGIFLIALQINSSLNVTSTVPLLTWHFISLSIALFSIYVVFEVARRKLGFTLLELWWPLFLIPFIVVLASVVSHIIHVIKLLPNFYLQRDQ